MDPNSSTIPPRRHIARPGTLNTPPVIKPPPPRQLTVNRPKYRLPATLALIVFLLAFMLFAVNHALKASKDPNAGKTPLPSPTVTATSVASVPSATVPVTIAPSVTTAPGTLPALSVQGTQILNASGTVVTLIGATRSSLEYAEPAKNNCAGDLHFTLADFQAMRAWGMNVVRLPLWSLRWLNLDKACPNYQATVKAAVANAERAGLYVIIDLHWGAAQTQPPYTQADGTPNFQFPLPDATNDVAFWQAIATTYKADPAVIFELLGEPHDITWNQWLNGGKITTANGSYQAIGMKDLVAQVRAIAPSNVIILSGLNWGYDLSGIANGYAIQASNILYGTHPFDYGGKEPQNWPTNIGAAAHTYAVIATEFGQYDCGTDYNSQAIAYFNQLHISWLAWEWSVPNVASPCNPQLAQGPFLLSDWSGTPFNAYGQYIKTQMLKGAPKR